MWKVIVFVTLCFLIYESIAQQKPCCQPNKFQMYFLEKIGTAAGGSVPTVQDVSGSVYYDFRNGLQAFSGYGGTTFSRVVYNYRKKSMWVIIPSMQTCNKYPFDIPSPQCLPAQSKLVGTYKQGSQMVNAYSVSAKTPIVYNATVMMTTDLCVLTSQAVTTQAGSTTQIIASAGFNYSPSVPSNVFTLPSYCPQNATKPHPRRLKRSATHFGGPAMKIPSLFHYF